MGDFQTKKTVDECVNLKEQMELLVRYNGKIAVIKQLSYNMVHVR